MLAISPADGLALTMVAVLAFTFGIIVSTFWIGARNAKRKPNIEEGLVDEEEEQPQFKTRPTKSSREEDPPAQPWEKDADWWR